MHKRAIRGGTLAAAACLTLSMGLAAVPAYAAEEADDGYKVLVVAKTLGFRHSHIPFTTQATIALGQQNGFTVDVWDPAQAALTLPSTPFTSAENLEQYDTIVFASPVDGTNSQNPASPRLLNDTELAALQGYIRAGGGYVGLHAATDAMHAVPWYSQLSGGSARFRNHPAQQNATMRVEDPNHPSTVDLPAAWARFDEWYNFTANPRKDVHVLLTLDETTYNPGNGRMGADHPLSWCQNFEGGRSWYEGAGHTDVSWSDPAFLGHYLKGIQWTAGVVGDAGDCITFRETRETLSGVEGDPALKAQVAGALDSAQGAADALNASGAVVALLQLENVAASLGSQSLDQKIDDLITWQRGVARGAAPDDAEGVPVQVAVVDDPGALTLTVGNYGDAVVLTRVATPTDRWRYSGNLPELRVTDSRNATQAGGGGWAASGQSSGFTSAAGTLTADHFGWEPRLVETRPGVTLGASTTTALDGGTGLSVPAPLASVGAADRRGTTVLAAGLVLDLPVAAAEGDYRANLTLSLFPVD
ncbi:ThuA domain-containing protein [Microbacterium rhizomatis]|uniref:ThuA domain-containing protein n=1 Tax=Microbacterium rhizomatis TaxID=1631477 RepID=A0A5J5J033_9MICO|nr:ThuA domain-containing protein [Microbacterium rhizomatis]KAA9108002.1 ThuA domain-containing protein [Microbacterium rhizomatis]